VTEAPEAPPPLSEAAAPDAAAPKRPNPLRSRWGMALIPLAAAAVIVGAVFGVEGLAANPIVSVSPAGLTTISGSFQPVTCPAGSPRGCAQGYVEAGARSVFLVLPLGCPDPAAGAAIRVTGRPDPRAGAQAYLATTCASG
jgi:hypothetical protein